MRLIYLCGKSTAILYDTDDKRKTGSVKEGVFDKYVSENRIFTDADDCSVEIELPLADCPQNIHIFGMITSMDMDTGDIFFDAVR